MARLFVVLFTLALGVAFPHQPSRAAERRLALVITNAAYAPSLPQLVNSHEDGVIMTAALRNVGFEVQTKRDLAYDAFKEEILAFVKRVKAAGDNAVAFFYFSGHGAADVSMGRETFIIPTGAKIDDTEELRARAISLRELVGALSAAQSRASFVVIDACRNFAFPSGFKSLQKGLQPERNTGGLLIGYATGPGDVAPDDNRYARALAASLQLAGIDASTAFKEAQLEVARASGRKQVPWFEDGLLERIYFREGAIQPPPPVPKPSPLPSPDGIKVQPAPPPVPIPAPPQVGTALLQPGAAVMTGFSGASLRLDPNNSVLINAENPVAAFLDTSSVKALTARARSPPAISAQVRASDIGQVFGVAIDHDVAAGVGEARRPSHVYLAATSAYGLPIVKRVGAGQSLVSLPAGVAGAEWSPGLFGTSMAGGPGSIWKIDGATGRASLFADIRLDGISNSGPGLGQLAFDPRTRQLFVSDLDTGMIHRLSMSGAELGYWDHGTKARPRQKLAPVPDDKRRADITSSKFDSATPATWGFTDKRRRVRGLVVRVDRLYYAVAEGPQIWSVGLRVDGTFAGDAQLELEVPGPSTEIEITQIRFDSPGNMYIALMKGLTVQHEHRPNAQRSAATILRFKREPGAPESQPRWTKEFNELPIGTATIIREAAFDLGYAQGSSAESDKANCRGTLWAGGTQVPSERDPRRQQLLLAWPIGGADARTSSAHVVEANRAFAVPGSIAVLAPCEKGDEIAGVQSQDQPPSRVGPPAWDNPVPADPNRPGPPVGEQGPSAAPGQGPRDVARDPGSQPPSGGIAQTGVSNETLPCARVSGQRFQCVAGAWELDLQIDDETRKGLDALTINPLVVGVVAEPSRQRRTFASDPFRVRFEGAASGSQIPLDVCLHDDALSRQNLAFRCCRGQINLQLPQTACAPVAPPQPAAAVGGVPGATAPRPPSR